MIESYTCTVDAVGNRTRVVEADGRQVDHLHDDLHRLTRETVTGGSAGTGEVIYTLDAVENRLTGVDQDSYLYDGRGTFVGKTVNGVTTEYLVDEQGPTGYAQIVEKRRGGDPVALNAFGIVLRDTDSTSNPLQYVGERFDPDAETKLTDMELLTDNASF